MKLATHTIVAALLAASVPAQDRLLRLVPADSKLVCWLDAQRLFDFVGRDLLRSASLEVKVDAGGEVATDWLERCVREWHFDPLTDIRSVVLFGAADDAGSLAFTTTARVDGVLERLEQLGALEAMKRGGVDMYQVVPGKLATALGRDLEAEADVPKAFLFVQRGSKRDPERLLVLGEDAREVAALARSATGGDTDRPAGDAAAPALRDGCLAYVAVKQPLADLIGDDPGSKIAGKTSAFTLQLSENDGEVHLTAAIETEAPKDARQVAAVINGLKALVTLIAPADEVPEELLEAVQNTQARAEGKSVVIDVALPSTMVREALRDAGGQRGGEKGDAKPRKGIR